jgi:hypothetical protein
MLTYTQYENPYGVAKAKLQNDELYKELGGNDTWTQYSKTGSLDTLLGTINAANEKMSISAIRNLPNWDVYDTEHKMQQLAVSLFLDDEKKKDYEETVYDEQGNPQKHNVLMTEKEYHQKQLDEYATAQRNIIKQNQERIAKENMGALEKATNTAAGALGNITLSVLNTAENIIEGVATVGTGLFKSIDALISDETEGGKWAAFDRAWREAGEINFMPTDDLRRSLYEWERLNTDLVTVEGKPTAGYNITNLLGDTLGQVLTMAAFNYGGNAIAKAGQGTTTAKVFVNAGHTLQKTGQILYWGSMGTNNYRELCQDESLASVPTIYLATNAALRAAAEYTVTKVMANTFGATTEKQIMFNYSPKSGIISGRKRLINDMLKDGIEEALQEYSGQFINTATYVIHSKFGTRPSPLQNYAGFSFADMARAFAAGALVSGLTSAVKVLTTKRIETDEVLRNKKGDIVTDEEGKPVMKKFSKWKSWNIIANTKSLMHEIQEFCNDTSQPIEYREAMLGQAVQSFQLLASFYGNIGQEATERVISFMQEFAAQYTTQTNQTYVEADLNVVVDKLNTEVMNLASSYVASRYEAFTAAEKELLAKKMQDANITKIKETHIKEEATKPEQEVKPRSKAQKDAKAKIDELLLMPNTKSVSISEDGTNSVNVDGHRIIPQNMIDSSSDILLDVRKNDASNVLIDNLIKVPDLKYAITEIHNLYKTNYHRADATAEEAVATLLNDSEFYKQCLYQTSQVARKLLLQLDTITEAATGDTITDDMYKLQLENTKKEWQKSIIEYLLVQDNVTTDFVSLLTPAQRSYVDSHRYNLEVGKRIKTGKTTDADLEILKKRIDVMPIPDANKKITFYQLTSGSETTRTQALNKLNDYYVGQYRSNFNGVVYPELSSNANWQLAKILLNNNVTLQTWMATEVPGESGTASERQEFRKEYYREQLLAVSGNAYTLNIAKNGTYTIVENITEDTQYQAHLKSMRFSEFAPDFAENIITNKLFNTHEYYEKYISKDISAVAKNYYSITDYIRDPQLLSSDTQREIRNTYGVVTESTTFAYLRDSILADTGTVSIVKYNNGEYGLADLKPFYSIAKDENFVITKDTKISDIIQAKYVYGNLKDTKIKLVDKLGPSNYDYSTNTIYLVTKRELTNGKVIDKTDNELRYEVLHEFEHAIQHQNNFSAGFAYIDFTTLPFASSYKILEAAREYFPELNVKGLTDAAAFDMLSRLIYTCVTGEIDARGWQGPQSYYAAPLRVPMFRRDVGNKTYLDTPFGTFEVTGAEPLRNKTNGTKGTKTDDALLSYAYPVYEKFGRIKLVHDLLDDTNYETYLYKDIIYGPNNKATTEERRAIAEEFDNKVQDNSVVREWVEAGTPEGKKELVKFAQDPEIRDIMLKQLWQDAGNNIPYDEFLNTDIPFFRVQTNSVYYPDDFVSAQFGDTKLRSYGSTMYNTREQYTRATHAFLNKGITGKETLLENMYLTIGIVKPKDLVGYVADVMAEILVPTDIASKSKTVKILGFDKDNNILLDPSEYTYNNMTNDNYKFIDSKITNDFTNQILRNNKKYLSLVQQPSKSATSVCIFPNGDTYFSKYAIPEAALYNFSKLYSTANNLTKSQQVQLFDNTLVGDISNNTLTINVNAATNRSTLVNLYITTIKLFEKNIIGTVIINDANGDTLFSLKDSDKLITTFESKMGSLLDKYNFDQNGNSHILSLSETDDGLNADERAQLEGMSKEEKEAYLKELRAEQKRLKKEAYITKHKKNVVTDAEVQPVAPRTVSNKEARGTNLEYFIRKYRPIQMDPETQNFVKAANPAFLNKSLWKYIGGSQQGTLTYQKNMRWLRTIDANKVNDYTWKLFNKIYFHNPVIKSFKQLNDLATIKSMQYYALWCALRDTGRTEMTEKKISQEKFDSIIEELKTEKGASSPLGKAYLKHALAYSKAMEELTEAKTGAARIVWANDFDGSIESGGRAAGRAYWLILSGYKAPDEIRKESSLNRQVGGSKGDDTSRELIDLISDPNSTDAFNDIIGDVPVETMNSKLKLFLARQVYNQIEQGVISQEDAEAKIAEIPSLVNALSRDELEERYFAAQYENVTGSNKMLRAVVEASKKDERLFPKRPKKTVSDNINRIGNKIMSYLSPKAKAKAEMDYPEYFKDGQINKWWQGKDISEYYKAEETLKEISRKARLGYWNNATAKAIFDTADRRKAQNEKLKGDKARLQEKVKNLKGEVAKYKQLAEINLPNGTHFDIYSNKNMPAKLEELLKTQFSDTSESTVKYIADVNDPNIEVSVKEFFDKNSGKLDTITQEEAAEIIDFYSHSLALEGDVTRNDIRVYESVRLMVLANFTDLMNNGIYQFDSDTVEQLNALMNTPVSTAATIMSVWSKVIGLVNPAKRITSALQQYYGIDVDEKSVAELVTALKKPTSGVEGKTTEQLNKEKITAIEEALAKIQNEVKEKQVEHKKGDKVWDTLWKIERWAMLSAPGTAIRNATSNIVVDKFGKITEKLGDLAISKSRTKKEAILAKFESWRKANPNATEIPKEFKGKLPGIKQLEYKQYKISGTQVDDTTAAFVDKMFNETLYTKTDANGKVIEKYSFYDTLSDGLSKYFEDKATVKKDQGIQSAANTMAKAIIIKMFGDQMFDTKNVNNKAAKAVMETMNKVSDFTFRWLSDDPWIKKETKRLFGKMLVEDKVDLSKGYSSQVLDTLAEAYAAAAYKYMHRRNFVNSIENAIRNRLGAAGYFAFKQILPFGSAGVNWFLEGLNYTPAGLALGIINYAKLENTIERWERKRTEASSKGQSSVSPRFAEYFAKQQIGKGIIGSAGLLIGLLLGAIGLAAIDDEDDKPKLRIGTNFYVDISGIFGTQGILMGITMSSIFGDDNKSFWEVMKATTSGLFDDFVFNDLYSNITYSTSFADYLVNTTENAMLSFIPNFWKAFTRNLYSFAPQYSKNGALNFMQRAMVQAIPGFAYALPKKIDIYTGKVQSKYYLPHLVKLINANSPIDINPYKVTDIEKEALAQDVNKSYLTGNYEDKKLDSKDTAKLNKKYGELNKDSLAELFASKKKYKVKKEDGTYVELVYNKMTQKQKKSAIQRLMSDNASYAKIYVYTSNGYKYYTTEEEYKVLKKLGIKNVYIGTKSKKGFY